jgi:hypothetical protein
LAVGGTVPPGGQHREADMQLDEIGRRRLRFVFDDAVVSLNLATDATFEDVAQRWEELAERHRGGALAIDITFPALAGVKL